MERSKNRYSRCSCCNKVAFPTKKVAIVASRKMDLRFYTCPRGNGYHLGHWRVYKDVQEYTRTPFSGSIEEMEKLAQELRQ